MADPMADVKNVAVAAPVIEEPAATAAPAEETQTATTAAKDEPEQPAASEEGAGKDADAGAKDQAPENAEDVEASDAAEKPVNILKTTRKIDYKNVQQNRKFDASLLPDSNDPTEIRKQVEFYFSDSNLPKDKHFWKLVGGCDNKAVELNHILSFKRMRRFKDRDTVVAALRESQKLNVAGEAGKEAISRKVPYVHKTRGDVARASIYAKGFGDEEPGTQLEIEQFFQPLGDVRDVRLRRTEENLFKGSVFVEFSSEEEAKKFLALEPKPQWKGHDLLIKSKIDYCEEKSQLIKEGKLKPSTNRRGFFEGESGGKISGHDKSGNGDFKKRGSGDRGRGRGRANFRGKGGGGRGNNRDSRGGFNRGGRGGGSGRGGHRGEDKSGASGTPTKPSNGNDVRPIIHSSAPVSNGDATGKRAREEAGHPAEEPVTKKVATGTT